MTLIDFYQFSTSQPLAKTTGLLNEAGDDEENEQKGQAIAKTSKLKTE